MAKKDLVFVDQVSFLAVAGTLESLVAIAYYRGYKGKLGTSARDMMSLGIESWLASLSPSEKSRYKEILASVKTAAAIRRTATLVKRAA